MSGSPGLMRCAKVCLYRAVRSSQPPLPPTPAGAATVSNDVQALIRCAVPTAIAGAVAIAVSGAVAGGKGALGSAVGVLLVLAFMGAGLIALQRTAKSLPHLFQAMGLLLYTAQLLLLFMVVALFKHTTLFNLKALALSLAAATLVWIAAQARAHTKAKILYVEPEKKPAPANSSS